MVKEKDGQHSIEANAIFHKTGISARKNKGADNKGKHLKKQ